MIVGGVRDTFYVDKSDCEVAEWEEPSYRPFANAEEFKPHRDEWIGFPSQYTYTRPLAFNNGGVWFNDGWVFYEELLAKALFEATGTPCGVLVE